MEFDVPIIRIEFAIEFLRTFRPGIYMMFLIGPLPQYRNKSLTIRIIKIPVIEYITFLGGIIEIDLFAFCILRRICGSSVCYSA